MGTLDDGYHRFLKNLNIFYCPGQKNLSSNIKIEYRPHYAKKSFSDGLEYEKI